MKTKSFFYMMMAAVAFGMVSCTQDEISIQEVVNNNEAKAVKVQVVDGGYGDATTRASESNTEETQGENTIMNTTFIAGDKIGVFSISAGGAPHYNNLELVYDGTEWKNPDGETFYYFTGMNYFAYYPYNENFDVSKVDWTKTSTNEFFAQYVNEWEPQEDQSTTLKYIASDLMIGGGALSGETFTFNMGHAMGLIYISASEELKGTVFMFPNLPESDAIDSLTADSKVFSFEQKVYKPSRKEGYYRYIVKPGTPQFISGMNPDGRVFSFTCNNVTAGHYKKYVVDGGFNAANSDLKEFIVQVGDILLNDLSFVHNPMNGTTLSTTYGYTISNKAVGVVGYLAAGLNDEYTEGYIHGLIFQKTLNWKDQFCSSGAKAAIADHPDITTYRTYAAALDDKSGLTNSRLFYERGSLDNPTYVYAQQTVALEDKLSYWFLPSTGQWGKLLEGMGCTVTPNGNDIQVRYYSGKSFINDINAMFKCVSINPTDTNSSAEYGYLSSSEYGNDGGSLIKVRLDFSSPFFSSQGKSSQYVNFWRIAAF